MSRKGAITKPEDLTKPEVKRIVLTPPENSSVGFYVKESLTELGLWEKVKDKVDYLPTIKDCYAEVANGGADAGFAYLGCPINIDPEEAQYSKVVAVQVLDDETYGGAVANASVLSSSKHPAEAMAFARFLKTPGAQAILKRSGLEPVK